MKPHRFDPISFVSGLLITIVGLLFLLPYDLTDLTAYLRRGAGWFWPVIFVVLGAAILIPTLNPAKKEDS